MLFAKIIICYDDDNNLYGTNENFKCACPTCLFFKMSAQLLHLLYGVATVTFLQELTQVISSL